MMFSKTVIKTKNKYIGIEFYKSKNIFYIFIYKKELIIIINYKMDNTQKNSRIESLMAVAISCSTIMQNSSLQDNKEGQDLVSNIFKEVNNILFATTTVKMEETPMNQKASVIDNKVTKPAIVMPSKLSEEPKQEKKEVIVQKETKTIVHPAVTSKNEKEKTPVEEVKEVKTESVETTQEEEKMNPTEVMNTSIELIYDSIKKDGPLTEDRRASLKTTIIEYMQKNSLQDHVFVTKETERNSLFAEMEDSALYLIKTEKLDSVDTEEVKTEEVTTTVVNADAKVPTTPASAQVENILNSTNDTNTPTVDQTNTEDSLFTVNNIVTNCKNFEDIISYLEKEFKRGDITKENMYKKAQSFTKIVREVRKQMTLTLHDKPISNSQIEKSIKNRLSKLLAA
jgi:hypothetical protein